MADEDTIAHPPAAETETTQEAGGAAAADGAAPVEGGAAAAAERPKRERKTFTVKPETVEAPDEDAKNKQVAARQAKMAAYEKRVLDIKGQIGAQSEARSSSGNESKALREQLKPIKDRSRLIRAQRGALIAELQKQTEARKAAQGKLHEMKKALKVGSLEEIDSRIARIEYEMSTSTLTLKEEKTLMLEIKDLRASRDKVRAVESMSSSVHAMAADSASNKSLQEQVKDLDTEMAELRARETDLITQLDAMAAKTKPSGPSLPELHKEQKAIIDKIKEEREAIRELESAFKKQQYLFRQYERDMRDWKWQQESVKYQERQKQREERQKEREAEDDETQYKKPTTHPWAEELFIVDDLIKYCKKHVIKTKDTAASTKKEFNAAAVNKAGLIPIGKSVSTDDDLEWLGPMSSKKKGGKKGGAAAAAAGGGGAAAAAAPGAPAAVEDKKLSLSIDAYSGFMTVGVKPPVFASHCPAAIQALQQARVRIQKLTAEDKTKAKSEAAAAAKADKAEAKKRESSKTTQESGVPTAAVVESAVDFRKAVRGVSGAHV